MYKVLVVEDEKLIRKGLIYMLDWVTLGCVVAAEAANGREGLEKIQEIRPDIVITDIRMPLMDGIEMIRAGLAFCDFESILLTGYGEFEYAQTALRLGVGEYLLKPVEKELITQVLKKLCVRIQKKELYERIESRLEGSDTPFEALDLSQLENSLKSASRHVAQMLRYVIGHYPQKLSLKELAAEMQISSTYLNQKFKEETTYTFNDFLNRYRIQRAACLLREGKLKVYEIAQQVGFSDYKYFIMVFRKYAGCTPTEFLNSEGVRTARNQQEDTE